TAAGAAPIHGTVGPANREAGRTRPRECREPRWDALPQGSGGLRVRAPQLRRDGLRAARPGSGAAGLPVDPARPQRLPLLGLGRGVDRLVARAGRGIPRPAAAPQRTAAAGGRLSGRRRSVQLDAERESVLVRHVADDLPELDGVELGGPQVLRSLVSEAE